MRDGPCVSKLRNTEIRVYCTLLIISSSSRLASSSLSPPSPSFLAFFRSGCRHSMSGSLLTEQVQQAPSQPPSTDIPQEGLAASLRAAALLTLKKKRKPVDNVPQPFPSNRAFAAPPSITLDYGTEISTGASSIASSPAVQPLASMPSVPDPMDVEGSISREEGEISDSEMSPADAPSKSGPSTPCPRQAELSIPQSLASPLAQPKIEPVSPTLSFATPSQPLAALSQPIALATSPPPIVDENHVRPGLTSESEF